MKKNIVKIAIISLILIFSLLPFFCIDDKNIKEFIENFGVFSNLGFLLLFAILPIFFFPVFVLATICGALFGLFWGSIYTLIGAMINCALMFFIAKFIGKDIKYPKILQKLQKIDKKNIFIYFCILRLLPIVPYNALNYAPAICQISFKSYMLSSFLGFLPWTPIFVNVGANLDNKYGLFLSLFITSIAILLSIFVAKKFKTIYERF